LYFVVGYFVILFAVGYMATFEAYKDTTHAFDEPGQNLIRILCLYKCVEWLFTHCYILASAILPLLIFVWGYVYGRLMSLKEQAV